MQEPRTVLVATLGGQPQVVTFALDALLSQGRAIDEVVVVHLGSPRYRQAFLRLAEAFPGDQYQGRPCHFRGVAVRRQGRVLDDVGDTGDGDALWRTIHELVGSLKASEQRLHLLLTGGRRLMALMAVSAAMLHLEHGDKVWHLYTPDAVRERARDGALLHVAPDDGVRLIEVPLAPLGAWFPGLRPLLGAAPAEVIAERTRWLGRAEQERCQAVISRLTLRQQEVLRALAAGLSPHEAAGRLNITVATVDAHKTVILDECRNAWDLPPQQRLSYHFLREKFGRYYETAS
jgi:CRISPR-associated protein Csx14